MLYCVEPSVILFTIKDILLLLFLLLLLVVFLLLLLLLKTYLVVSFLNEGGLVHPGMFIFYIVIKSVNTYCKLIIIVSGPGTVSDKCR